MGNKRRRGKPKAPNILALRGLPTITFRPRVELEMFWTRIKEWCELNGHSLGSVFNSYIPAIAIALYNNCYVDKGAIFVRSDFGDIKICDHSEHIPKWDKCV